MILNGKQGSKLLWTSNWLWSAYADTVSFLYPIVLFVCILIAGIIEGLILAVSSLEDFGGTKFSSFQLRGFGRDSS